jgi:hypothetical protein
MYDLSDCFEFNDFNRYIKRSQEEVVFRGQVEKNINGRNTLGVLIVTADHKNNWTIFESFGTETVCLMERGVKAKITPVDYTF